MHPYEANLSGQIRTTKMFKLKSVSAQDYSLLVQEVKEKLAPWEKKIAAAQSKLNIATGERDLLAQQQTDAEQRLKVYELSI